MTPIKDESITNIIRKEIHHRQSIKNIKDISSTSKNAEGDSGDEYTLLLHRTTNKIKKEKRKKTEKIQDSNENSSPVIEDNNFKYNVPIKSTVKTIKGKKRKRQAFCDLSKDNFKNVDMILPKISKINNESLKTNMEYTYLLKNQLKKKKKKKEKKFMMVKKSQVQQKYKRIPCPSKDTVIKLVEMLQRDIRHSIRQIELLTGKTVTVGRWSAEKVCTANLLEIKMQEDLWASYVRGFDGGYRIGREKSNSNHQNSKQQLEVESNQTLVENSYSPQAHKKSRHMMMTRQKVQLNSSKSEITEICEEAATNLCSNQATPGDPSEFMVLEPDVKAYFDAQMTNEYYSIFYKNVTASGATMTVPSELGEKEAITSSSQSAMSEGSSENEVPAMFGFGTHMLCEGGGSNTALSEPFACSVCESTFESDLDLTLHSMEHTGKNLQPYTCEACDKTYLHSRNLIKHFRKHHHLVELPYACDVCSKRFLRPESLASHYVVHTGERPYDCNQCDKSYATSGTLARHVNLVHGSGRS